MAQQQQKSSFQLHDGCMLDNAVVSLAARTHTAVPPLQDVAAKSNWRTASSIAALCTIFETRESQTEKEEKKGKERKKKKGNRKTVANLLFNQCHNPAKHIILCTLWSYYNTHSTQSWKSQLLFIQDLPETSEKRNPYKCSLIPFCC